MPAYPKEAPQPDFLQSTEASTVRVLSPEIARDRVFARAADLVSLEAENPEEMSHNAMTEEQLTRWMQGDDRHMTRFLIVDPNDYDMYVDPQAFNRAIQEAIENGQQDQVKALQKMRTLGVVGFTYLYNDAYRDADFKRRVQVVREKEGVSEKHSVWELNTWYVPGTGDTYVKRATADTLREFSGSLARERTMVMFVDSGDLKEAYALAEDSEVTLRKLSMRGNRTTAELALQDTRVLRGLGFHFVVRVRYDEKPTLDFAYARNIQPHQKL